MVELYSWNLYNFINQWHLNKLNKKQKTNIQTKKDDYMTPESMLLNNSLYYFPNFWDENSICFQGVIRKVNGILFKTYVCRLSVSMILLSLDFWVRNYFTSLDVVLCSVPAVCSDMIDFKIQGEALLMLPHINMEALLVYLNEKTTVRGTWPLNALYNPITHLVIT